ncbi:MAG: DNA repair and recombination protein RadB [Candidatus Woesearchaeota archaeon]
MNPTPNSKNQFQHQTENSNTTSSIPENKGKIKELGNEEQTQGLRISTGSAEFDQFLRGGYEKGVITTIYGPAGSGKTNLMLLALASAAKQGKKIIYIDTEANFSLERLMQISPEYKQVLNNTLLFRPTTFEMQHQEIVMLASKLTHDIGLIIVDSIGALYRLEWGKESTNQTNKQLSIQFAKLAELASKQQIPVLLTNQVYASFEDKESVHIVGGDIVNYASKALLELKKTKTGRIALIKKHRSLPEHSHFLFKIVEEGIEAVKKDEGKKDEQDNAQKKDNEATKKTAQRFSSYE